MAKRDLEEAISGLRHDANQQARRQALFVSWRRIEESAASYVEWLGFSLWIRAARLTGASMPLVVRAELESRCAGFVEAAERAWRDGDLAVWRMLNDWIESHQFADAKSQGWFDAVVYYAYTDIRCMRVWLNWDYTVDAWQVRAPAQVPSFEDWVRQDPPPVHLNQTDAKSVALLQQTRVQPDVLAAAVSSLIEARARGLWIASTCEPERVIPKSVLEDLELALPETFNAKDRLVCDRLLFLRVIRRASASSWAQAREGKWPAALRYSVISHPRYHRIIHYFQKCEDERSSSGIQRSASTFAGWLHAADQYQVHRVISTPSAGSCRG